MSEARPEADGILVRRYRVVEGFELPVADLPGGADAELGELHRREEFVDTADLRLTRAGATLARTEDEGSIWRLEVPAPPGGEAIALAEPGSGAVDEPPQHLCRLVTALARHAPLTLVARVVSDTTTRTARLADGSVHWAAADARFVTEVGAGEWMRTARWLQVEAADADTCRVLDELVTAAGGVGIDDTSVLAYVLGPSAQREPDVPPAPAHLEAEQSVAELVRADLRAHVRAALAWEPAVRLDREDAVHKMRVSVRRLRSSLRTFGPLLDPTEVDRLEPELQWLAAELGAPRDAEVTRDHLLAAVGELPARFVRGPVIERVADALGRRHREAHEQLLGHLDNARYLRLLDEMVGFAAAPPLTGESATPVRATVPRLMRLAWRKLAKRVRRALEQPPGPEQDQLLHAARKAAKQARYAAEACARAFGEPAAALARQAEAIQELLGAHQDAVVAQHVLLSLADDAHALADDTTTYGILIGAEVARADNVRRELGPAWREASRPGHRQWLEH